MHRGVPPDSFLDELIAWGTTAPDILFFPNARHDIYSNIVHKLGPWQGILHRRAAMLEVMRVLAGIESSWNWTEGLDKSKLTHTVATRANTEAGAWQVSADSMGNAQELKDFIQLRVGSVDPLDFQRAMKRDHTLAMEYIVRLLRITVRHNGPTKRKEEINAWLRRDAVEEFLAWISPPKRALDDIDVPQLRGRWR